MKTPTCKRNQEHDRPNIYSSNTMNKNKSSRKTSTTHMSKSHIETNLKKIVTRSLFGARKHAPHHDSRSACTRKPHHKVGRNALNPITVNTNKTSRRNQKHIPNDKALTICPVLEIPPSAITGTSKLEAYEATL
jgi:hypothetical protein